MTFTDFVSGVAAMEPTHTKKMTKEILTNAIEYLKEQIAAGETVSFVGFASFDSVTVEATRRVNPQTQEPIMVPEHQRPRCRFSPTFKRMIKEN